MDIFLLAALLAALFVCLKTTNVMSIRTKPTYTLYAALDNIGDLKVRFLVSIGDVIVGRVADIMLDLEACLSRVALEVRQRYNHIPSTSLLNIRIPGLLGKQYLALNVGFEDPELGTVTLKDGDTTQDTKPATVLEDSIGQFPYGGKGDNNENSGDALVVTPGNSETIEPVGITR